MKDCVIGFLLCAFSLSLQATEIWAYDQKVTEVRYVSDSGFNIYVESLPAVCNSAFRVRVGQKGLDSTEAQGLMSLTLTGLSLKSNVNIQYDDASNQCYVRYVGVEN